MVIMTKIPKKNKHYKKITFYHDTNLTLKKEAKQNAKRIDRLPSIVALQVETVDDLMPNR